MNQTANYLGFDLGAESGRAVVGRFDGERLDLSTLHRFPNKPVRTLDSLYWDVLGLFAEMKRGLGLYRLHEGDHLEGIGLDTWGVDFALLGRNGELLSNPRHYRDPRTEGMLQAAFERVSREEIFEHTGAQFMEINTLYQLLSMKLSHDPTLDLAETLLMISEACEFTVATTTQFYDPRERGWSRALLTKMGLPTHILTDIIQPGTVIGPLYPSIAEETGDGAGGRFRHRARLPRHGFGRRCGASSGRGLCVHQLGNLVGDGHRERRADHQQGEPGA